MQGPDILCGLPRLTPRGRVTDGPRAHPPDARAVTYIYRRVVRVIHRFLGLRVKMCVWLGVSRGLDLAFLNAD